MVFVPKPLFDKYNPWKEKLVYIPSVTDATDVKTLILIVRQCGMEFDVYVLPSPSGYHSLGVRYGKEPEDYISIPISNERATQLLKEYGRYAR